MILPGNEGVPALAEGRMPSFPVFGLLPGGGERQ